MKCILFCIILFYLLAGCKKEESTNYYAYLKNKTLHKIEIRPYVGNIFPADKVVKLLAGETKQIANGFDRGIVGNVGFNSSYLNASDSIVVIFDNLYSITHYFKSPVIFSTKYYLYSSLRNVGNYLSYIYTYQDLSKHKRESTYT